jgi:hypothetical protein
MMATIHRLDTHRIVHLPLKTPDQIVREHGVEAQHKPDFRETRHVVIREPLFDRIADALGSRDFLIFYSGIYVGCLLTVGFAYLWSLSL